MLNPCCVLSQFSDFCYNKCVNQPVEILCLIEATNIHYTFPFKLVAAYTVYLWNSRTLDAEAASEVEAGFFAMTEVQSECFKET